MGRRIKTEGFPEADRFTSMWTCGGRRTTAALAKCLWSFGPRANGPDASSSDEVHTASLLLLKVQATRAFAEQLLDIDLVARVDLPPHVAAGYTRFFEDFPPLDQGQQPDENDPMSVRRG